MYEVPLAERTDVAGVVVEGRVTSQTAYWNAAHTLIYTAHQVEVYGVLKGSLSRTSVQVVTRGGTVGDERMVDSPGVEIDPGAVGVFFLQPDASTGIGKQGALPSYSVVAGPQGVVAYDPVSGKAHDPFNTYSDVRRQVYQPIEQRAGQVYRSIRAFDAAAYLRGEAKPSGKVGIAPSISGFSPGTATAGTKTEITITGTGFGATQGTVYFSNADAGGNGNYISAPSSHVQSWTDTEIRVWVPSYGGTGPFVVETAGGQQTLSPGSLTVPYALINVQPSNPLRVVIPELIDTNGNGGYTFAFNTDFNNDTGARDRLIDGLVTWRCNTGYNVDIDPNTTSISTSGRDGTNVIAWDTNDPLGAGTLGRTTSFFSGCSVGGSEEWFLAEADQIYNANPPGGWYVGSSSFGIGGTHAFDFQTVATHELGHAHDLGHVIDNAAVMHYAVAPEQVKRSLKASSDLAGANDVMSQSTDGSPPCALGEMNPLGGGCSSVTTPNSAPTAVNDAASTGQGVPVEIDVLANDSDADGTLAPASVLVQSGPSNGSTQINTATGAITYTPSAAFSGQDSFTYTVRDDDGALSNVATVTVTVTAPNMPPTATNDAAVTNRNVPVEIDVLANDSDADGTLDPASVSVQSGPSNGSTQVNTTTGAITYTPANGFSGQDSFTYAVLDDDGAASNAATVTVNVVVPNTPPVASDDSATTGENDAVVIDVLANDSDSDGTLDATSVTVQSGPSNGATQVNASTGAITYTPANGFSGQDTFAYTVDDDDGAASNAATVTVDVTANTAPLATDDTATTDQNVAVQIDVLANDSDSDGTLDATSVSVQSGPSNGATQVNGTTGAITYTPSNGFSGQDTFTYTVLDDDGASSNAATVTVDVIIPNDPPVAVDDAVETDENEAVQIDVLANDSDDDGTLDVTSVTIQAPADNGSTQVNATTGAVTYTPLSGFTGQDSFTYTVLDDLGASSNVATVTIDIIPNDPPVAVDDAATTAQNQAVVVDVLSNDHDDDGTLIPATVKVIAAPANGTAVPSTVDGTITYTPPNGFSGEATFTYTVRDDDGATSNEATVTVDVFIPNAPPVAVDDAAQTGENDAVVIDVLANDSDDGTLDPTSVTVQTPANNGSTQVNATTGAITYTPLGGFSGQDSFAYTVLDDVGAPSNAATVTVDVVPNDPPIAVDDGAATPQDQAVVVAVLANDHDDDGVLIPATLTLQTSPGTGTAVPDGATGTITYTPPDGFVGQASFTYTVRDDDGATSNAATVTVNVFAPNDPPIAHDDAVTTDEDAPIVVDVLSNDEDDLNALDPSSVSVVGTPSMGTADVLPQTGGITYVPNADVSGEDTFTYTVRDANGQVSNAATVVVTITPVNDPPFATNDAAQTDEDVSVVIAVLDNDVDVDSAIDPTTLQVTTVPAHGTATVQAPAGTIRYVPGKNYNGADSFRYSVRDAQGAVSNDATVRVMVAPVNDPPIAFDDATVTMEDTPVFISVLANDADAEGGLDVHSVVITTLPAHGGVTVNAASGVVRYAPSAGFVGNDAFGYTVDDVEGATSNAAVVSVSVGAANAPPVAGDDAATTNEDTPVVIDILANDADQDGSLDPGTVQIVRDPVIGTLSLDEATGVVTYTPNAEVSGTDTFAYMVRDDTGLPSNQATVTVTISPVDDAPVAVDDAASTDEEQAVTIPLLANDTDVDSDLDVSSVTIVSGPAHGTVDVDPASGDARYTPAPNFSGDDRFTYTVADVEGAVSNTAAVVVSVAAVNDPPAAASIITPASGQTVVIQGNATDELTVEWAQASDPEGEPVTYVYEVRVPGDVGEPLIRIDTGTQTRFTITFGALATLLTQHGVQLNQSVTLQHRVISSDGVLDTAGPMSQLVLTRGTITGVGGEGALPSSFALRGNYPNPFNPTTTVAFDLPEAAAVRVEVFNLLGKRVLALPEQTFQAGANQSVVVDAGALPSGVYLYRVTVVTPHDVQVKSGRMSLIK